MGATPGVADGAGDAVGVSGADASGADASGAVVGAGSDAGEVSASSAPPWQPTAKSAASVRMTDAAIIVVNRFATVPYRRLSGGWTRGDAHHRPHPALT